MRLSFLRVLKNQVGAVSAIKKLKKLWARRIHEEAAGTVLFHCYDEKSPPLFLLIERGEPYNDWVFPKGKIETHENPRAAALRETREETGLEVEIISELSSVTYTYYWEPTNEKATKTVYYFLAKSSTNRVPLNNNFKSDSNREANSFKQVKFYNVEEASRLVTHQSEKNLLYEANQAIKLFLADENGHT